MNANISHDIEEPNMVIIQRKANPKRSKSQNLNVGLALVSLFVALYWLVLYRTTWSLDWAFLAMCSTLVAGLISTFDLTYRHARFRRNDDSLPLFEIVLVVASFSSASLLYFKTFAA